MNNKFFKIRLLKEFLTETEKQKNILLNELIDQASNDVVASRRFRMLNELCEFESQIIQKIYYFETNDPEDFGIEIIQLGISKILNRAA